MPNRIFLCAILLNENVPVNWTVIDLLLFYSDGLDFLGNTGHFFKKGRLCSVLL